MKGAKRLLMATTTLAVIGCSKEGPRENQFATGTNSTQAVEAAPREEKVPAPDDLPVGRESAAGESDQLARFYEGSGSQRDRLTGLQGSRPPALDVENWLNSDQMSLEDLKGKVIVLDFWATWCGPCLAAVPHTNEMAEKYGDDVVIIGICHTRGSETMAETAEERGITYAIASDVDGKTVETYQVNGFPDYYLIDRSGILRIADCSNAAVDEAIEALLTEGTL